jgi:hypothetical protein
MAIALQSRLAKDLAGLDRADDLAQARRKDDRRLRLIHLAGEAARDSIEVQRRSGRRHSKDEEAIEDEIEQVSHEAYERLTDAEDYGDLMGRPFDEAVAAICAELGLSPDWTARIRGAVQAPRLEATPRPSSSGEAAQPRRPGDPTAPGFDEPCFEDRRCWVPGPPPSAPPEDDG